MSHPRSDSALNSSVGTYFLGRYRVVDEIGVGGMASVHLARMDGPGGFQKWVAIKRIHSHLIEEESFVQMFLDEAMIAARISHPNVATVFDLGKDQETHWIAMEYLHGEPLRELMRKSEETGHPMPPEIACKVIADAAEGLHAAHELTGKSGEKLGLVHRDVTPHNIFVTYDGVTKVVDFGIAKFNSRLSSSTRAGTLKGKLAYMSPEQVHGETIDRRTDIFALGVVLWELTTGQRLFRMDNDLDTLAKVQECNVPRPSTIVRGYPMDLEKIVLKALVKNRAERYRTAREFSRALQSFFMRRGLFIASDEVSACMHSAFQERIGKRDAHLRWAAEVTQTVNIDQLRGEAAVKAEAAAAQASSGRAAGIPKILPAAGMPAKRNEDGEDGAPTVQPLSVQQQPNKSGPPRPRPAAGLAPLAPPRATLQDDSQVDLPTIDNRGFEEPETQMGKAVRAGSPKPRTPTITGASLKDVMGSAMPSLVDEDDDGDKTEVDSTLLADAADSMHGSSDAVPTVSPPAGFAQNVQIQAMPIPFSNVGGGAPQGYQAPPTHQRNTMPRMSADMRTVTAQAVRHKRNSWLIVAVASAAVAAIGLITLILVLVSGPSKPKTEPSAATSAKTADTSKVAEPAKVGAFGAVRAEFQTVLREAPQTALPPTQNPVVLAANEPSQPKQSEPPKVPEPKHVEPSAQVAQVAQVKPPDATKPVEKPVADVKPKQVDPPKDTPKQGDGLLAVDGPKTKPGGTGFLTVICLGVPCTQIFVDGTPAANGTNLIKHVVPAGPHSVKMVRPSGAKSQSVTIEPGVTQRVSSSG
jgi:eukaryotic-like serine/threonine-protein kinase